MILKLDAVNSSRPCAIDEYIFIGITRRHHRSTGERFEHEVDRSCVDVVYLLELAHGREIRCECYNFEFYICYIC